MYYITAKLVLISGSIFRVVDYPSSVPHVRGVYHPTLFARPNGNVPPPVDGEREIMGEKGMGREVVGSLRLVAVRSSPERSIDCSPIIMS